MRSTIPGTLILVSACFGSAMPSRAAGIDLERRVAAQRAIEQVYWSHRIWPRENPGPKPPLSSVLSEADLRARVQDDLRLSQALATVWHRPVTATELQAELDRIVARTHDGAMLRELFSSLGNDPELIAETLARSALVRRLARSWYALDPRFHRDLRARAEQAMATCHDPSCLKTLGGSYSETTWRLSDAAPQALAGGASISGGPIDLDADRWDDLRSRLARAVGGDVEALPVGRVGALIESQDVFTATAVLLRTEHEVTVATATWAKTPFETWWAGERASLAADATPTGGTFTVASPAAAFCTDDTWAATPVDVPDPRSLHVSVWTGSEMIVWGGVGAVDLADGGRYDPATDTWVVTSAVGAPSARDRATAVWTGTEMIVWGGSSAGAVATGARYNPSTDTWTATSTGAGVPTARYFHTAVWTGTEMIVWGGYGASGPVNTGGRYSPTTNSWTATSTGANVPEVHSSHTAVWTGTQMIVWGGQGATGFINTGGRYTPGTDTWAATSVGTNVPAARIQHTAVWTGSVMVVWGGQPGPVNTGGRYNPSTNAWTTTSTGANVPAARDQHTAVWTGTEMIVWGGYAVSPTSTYLNTGGRYNPSTNAWTTTSTGPIVPAGRVAHTAVWSGTEMIVWGGGTPSASNGGGRYKPTTDTWVPTSAYAGVPTARFNHRGIWTGAEMILWGGIADATVLDTGSRYDPTLDAWTPTTQVGAPTARQLHSAVWTGSKMIVWGGGNADYGAVLNTGGAYDPTAGTWTATSSGAGNPEARRVHTAVWTGTEMIVWGGQNTSVDLNTGGRYNPATDSWAPTSTGANVPSARAGHTATWTGSAMVVIGSDTGDASGGRYDPATDSWLPTSTGANAPQLGAYLSSSVWTGSRVILWGGYTFQELNSGELYDPVGDTWTPTSTGENCPSARYAHNGVWTGSRMIVWGGNVNTGARYDPATDTWTPTSTGTNCPARRANNPGVWTGKEMIIWGGSPTTATGGRYCSCGLAAPSAVPALAVDRPVQGTARLSFTYGAGDAPVFDALRGDLSALRSSAGDYSTSTTSCLGNGVAGPVDDPALPAAGSGFWYLVRPLNCGGIGSYDSGAASQIGSRDAEILASGNDCGSP